MVPGRSSRVRNPPALNPVGHCNRGLFHNPMELCNSRWMMLWCARVPLAALWRRYSGGRDSRLGHLPGLHYFIPSEGVMYINCQCCYSGIILLTEALPMARPRAYSHHIRCSSCGSNWMPKRGTSKGRHPNRKSGAAATADATTFPTPPILGPASPTRNAAWPGTRRAWR